MASKTLRLRRNLLPKTTIQKQMNSRARKAYAQVRNNNKLNLVNVKTNRAQARQAAIAGATGNNTSTAPAVNTNRKASPHSNMTNAISAASKRYNRYQQGLNTKNRKIW